MEKDYLEWLMDQLGAEDGPDGYSLLCGRLHQSSFLPCFGLDWNRNSDGLDLRAEWAGAAFGDKDAQIDAVDELDRWLDTEHCTMLELIVVLVRRIAYETMDSLYEAANRKWFLELIQNCGLDACMNKEMEDHPDTTEDIISDCLCRLICRKYGWDGEEGFFPLQAPATDQRAEELLTQMNYYIQENYDIL